MMSDLLQVWEGNTAKRWNWEGGGVKGALAPQVH